MAGLGNNLYPPIFKNAYAPAFDKTNPQGCRIYFSLSPYNSLGDFAKYESSGKNVIADLVQVSIQNQNTNYSALNLNKYPSGIMNTRMYKDDTRITDDKYYIIINSLSTGNSTNSSNTGETFDNMADLAEGNVFNAGEFYKVQIRFTSNQVTLPAQYSLIKESWYNSNINYFSQWSQVVLVKGITKPVLELNDFSKNLDEEAFTLQDIYVVGKVYFPDKNDNEYLKKYQIKLYDESGKEIESSGQIYSNAYNNINGINYKIKYNLDSNKEESFSLVISLQTNNLYEEKYTYPFKVDLIQYTILRPDIQIQAQGDQAGGCIKVHTFSSSNIDKLGTNFIIRRSSSKDNFQYWEDMYTFLAPLGKKLDQTWIDKTVESGVFYKYCLQQRNVQGFRSNFIQIKQPVVIIFEDIFLIDKQQQLKVRFDPQVNNYSHVVSQTLTQTIGSKYPFIRRNGNVNYRTFSLSGTISYLMDIRENGMKASPNELYGVDQNKNQIYTEYYAPFNQARGINIYNDSVYERDFREKVIDFLYRNTVKLYKSTTQGNILVKLMNISFTPNNTLSRHIYSFTCTAQEIDEFNIQNCNKYGIQSTGQHTNETQVKVNTYGQISIPNLNYYYSSNNKCKTGEENDADPDTADRNSPGIYKNRQPFGTNSELHFASNQNIITKYLLPKYSYLENDLIKIDVDYLSYLKIEFTSSPYLISQNGEYFEKTTDASKAQLLGHIIYINGDPIIVGPEGIYELSDPSTKVTSLSFLSDSQTGTISYQAIIVEEEREENIPKMYGTFKRIGQLFGYFNSSDSIYRKIYMRYYQSFASQDDSTRVVYSQHLQSLKGLRIQTKPNTVFLIQEAQDKVDSQGTTLSYDYYVMNDTGLLDIYDEKTDIRGCYIIGPKLKQVNENVNGEVGDDEYVLVDETYQDFSQITRPKKNHVYKLEDGSMGLFVLRSRFYDTNEINMVGYNTKEPEEVSVIDYRTILINKKLADSVYCIFYGGSWYLFSLDQGIVLGYPTEAIIDYYCQILRERY